MAMEAPNGKRLPETEAGAVHRKLAENRVPTERAAECPPSTTVALCLI